MKIKIANNKVNEALNLLIIRSGGEKRIMSPKPGEEPYWHHSVRVYKYLIDLGESDEDLLTAAILHDSVEDGHITRGELNEKLIKRCLISFYF